MRMPSRKMKVLIWLNVVEIYVDSTQLDTECLLGCVASIKDYPSWHCWLGSTLHIRRFKPNSTSVPAETSFKTDAHVCDSCYLKTDTVRFIKRSILHMSDIYGSSCGKNIFFTSVC